MDGTCSTHASMIQASYFLGAVIMDFSKKPEEILQYLKRRYSKTDAIFAVDEPTFVTSKRRAAVFLRRDWQAGCELGRLLKNKGHSVTLRVKKLTEYALEPIPGEGTIRFEWSEG